jgi:hypothetical protein
VLAAAEHWMAQSLLAAGDPAAAEPHARSAVTHATGDDVSIAANARLDVARVEDALGREVEATAAFTEAGEAFREIPFRADLAAFDLALGAFHIAHGRPEEGQPLVERARATFAEHLGPQTPFLEYAERAVEAARARTASR